MAEKKKESRGDKHTRIVNRLILDSQVSLEEQDRGFPYKVVRTESGSGYLCKIVGRYHIVPIDDGDALEDLCNTDLGPSCKLSANEAKEILSLFKIKVPKIKTVEPIGFKTSDNMPNYTFQRLDFEWPMKEGKDCEDCGDTFRNFLGNMSNPDAFSAYLGSLFISSSDRQQYLWLYGSGNNGKSSIMRFLSRLFGPSAHTDSPEMLLKTKHGTAALLGKRLCCFPDTNNHKFMMSGAFKMLTGGDNVRIEQKFKGVFSTALTVKFIVSSNEMPQISAMECDLRRIIFCKLGRPAQFDPKFESKLWDDREKIVGYCIDKYLNNMTFNFGVESDNTEIEEFAKSGEYDYFEQIIEQAFITDAAKQEHWVTPGQLRIALGHMGLKSTMDQHNFIKHLREFHGITCTRLRESGNRRRAYQHLALNDPKAAQLPTFSLDRVVTDMQGHTKWEKRDRAKNIHLVDKDES